MAVIHLEGAQSSAFFECADGQCESVFWPKQIRCVSAAGHSGMHGNGMRVWIDPAKDARDEARKEAARKASIDRQAAREAIAECDRAFAEVLGEDIIKP